MFEGYIWRRGEVMKPRFRESGKTLASFIDLFLVRCPGCDKCAKVVLRDGKAGAGAGQQRRPAEILFAPRRLVCEHCGYTRDYEGKRISSDGAFDWYFQMPLWLAMHCCGQMLWAYNEEHLRFLEEYVRAELREGYPNGTLASRLPVWIKSAKNRDDILRCIRKLRDTLE
jgi:hypothetical protein